MFICVEYESVEQQYQIVNPCFTYSNQKVINITVMSAFCHEYRCKQCDTLLITRNRFVFFFLSSFSFSIHGWDHSTDFDLFSGVISIFSLIDSCPACNALPSSEISDEHIEVSSEASSMYSERQPL